MHCRSAEPVSEAVGQMLEADQGPGGEKLTETRLKHPLRSEHASEGHVSKVKMGFYWTALSNFASSEGFLKVC